MSKVDAQRAMRDARYAAYQARRESEGDPVAPAPAAARPVARPAAAAATVSVDEPVESAPPVAVAAALCGHRSIASKSCIRPAGHPEKSHRYG